MTSLCIVVPVFHDWPSFGVLLDDLDAMAKTLPLRVQVVGVDDWSTDPPPEWSAGRWAALAGVEIVKHIVG